MNPVDTWNGLLGPDELSAGFFAGWSQQLRDAKLTFGDRVHCPFLRPLFVTDADEARIRQCAEAVAAIGERVAAAALDNRALLDAVGLQPDEERLVRIEPGYARASTASRLDTFLLPDSLEAAEYNAESPAGFGYTETLADVFARLSVMARFTDTYDVEAYHPSTLMLDALLASYREWGGTASPPLIAIVDWREVPTWTEFEILQARFTALGVPTIVCDPRDLEFDGRTLGAKGRRIDLVYRRVLMNDILARGPECEALIGAYQARAACVANTFRCKIPHKKAFFAVLTDQRFARMLTPAEADIVRQHIPWTRLVREGRTTRDDAAFDLVPYIRNEREHLVLKPNDEYGGSGVTLGWEHSASAWDEVLQSALGAPAGSWIVQERIRIRREVFPWFQGGRDAVFKDMLVDMAPYLFRGRLGGFLTRLSATGLANVTSGGGQVPSFKIRKRSQD
jgi:hypothetical protein